MKRIKSYEIFLKENRFPADDEQVDSKACIKCDCEDCSKCDCEKCDCPKCCGEQKSDVVIAKPVSGYYGKPRKVVDDEVVESQKKFEFFNFLKKDKGLSSAEKELLICMMDMNYDEVSTKEDIMNRCCSDCSKEEVEKAFSDLESKKLIHYDSELNDYKPTKAGFEIWKGFENPKNYEITRRNYR